MKQSFNSLLIDILSIIPEKSECFIQAPSLENIVIKNILRDSNFDYYKFLILDKTTKAKLIEQEVETSFAIYIQSIEIKNNDNLLFEGFDGVEYGIISKNLVVPEWFKNKYIPDTCIISNDW
jgi:hypothetical protein